jgi:hypothetical protein
MFDNIFILLTYIILGTVIYPLVIIYKFNDFDSYRLFKLLCYGYVYGLIFGLFLFFFLNYFNSFVIIG